MAAIVIRDNAKATWLTGLAGVRAKACSMLQRAMACAAATILICAVAAALFQLAAELLSFPKLGNKARERLMNGIKNGTRSSDGQDHSRIQ